MSNFQNPKVPPTGGRSAARTSSSFEMRRTVPASDHCSAPRGLIARSPEIAEPASLDAERLAMFLCPRFASLRTFRSVTRIFRRPSRLMVD